jgi:drug/metabolite transporter (DMT)-like permease
MAADAYPRAVAEPGLGTPVPLLAGLGVTLVLWASAFVAIRYVDRFVGAGALALGRLLVGSLCLGAVAAVRREQLPHGRALGFSVLCGVLWFGAYNLALNLGERRLDAGTSALLVNTGPIFLALLAGAFLNEGFPRRLLSGCVVAFCGTALIAVGVASHGSGDLWGVVLCVGAALAYAAGVVAQKPALRSASALSVTWVACSVGAVSMLGYAGSLDSAIRHIPLRADLWMLYLGIGPTAVGFLCWATVLSRWQAGRLGVTTYLVPPLVVIIGWLALSETPPWLALPGGVLCLAGVAWSRRA